MVELEGYPVVDLTRPHGFLVWKGKQTTIASPTPLSEGDVMVTSDGEMFGIATLGQPIQVNLGEFERMGEKHRIRPEERAELWPTADSFYLYPIKGWKGFSHSRPIVITLQPDVLNGAKDETLSTLLESVQLTQDVTYDLVLMQRQGGVKKKEVAAMPYEINDDECVVNTESGEVEKCHDTHEEAMAHLEALNINVVKEEKAGRRLASSMLQRLKDAKDALQELMGWAEYTDREPEEEAALVDMMKGASGIGVKMVEGEPWHLSWSSNSFEDRDGEIFSLKSLEQYVKENEENEVKGYFNLWHIRNTDFAEKRYQAIVGKFLFEAGPYLKDAKGQAALAFFKEYSAGHPDIAPEGWGASVEYRYLPEERKSKIYEWTWITRTSTLARGAAANVWTKASQENFIMNDEQRKAANAIFGEEFTNKLVSSGEQKTAELEQAGVANKQAATPEGEAAAAEVESKEVDLNQLVEGLAAKMMGNISEALTPVLTEFHQQITTLNSQVVALGEELKAMKSQEAVKQQVELPRFTFNMLRASQDQSTVVPEGAALKNQKPQEADAPASNGGSIAPAYFPSIKR